MRESGLLWVGTVNSAGLGLYQRWGSYTSDWVECPNTQQWVSTVKSYMKKHDIPGSQGSLGAKRWNIGTETGRDYRLGGHLHIGEVCQFWGQRWKDPRPRFGQRNGGYAKSSEGEGSMWAIWRIMCQGPPRWKQRENRSHGVEWH